MINCLPLPARPWLLSLGLLLPLAGFAQSPSVGIGTTAPAASAALDVSSTNKGLLAPRMTLATRNSIASPANGLLIYQTNNTPGLYQYQAGTGWVRVGDDLGSHAATQNLNLGPNLLVGNAGTTGLGISSAGNVGLGPGAAHTRLSISPGTTEPKITLYDGGNSNNHYGLGVSPGQFNYHVSGGTASHVFYASGKNGNGTELLRIKGDGNVGVGTDTPGARLHVAGNLRLLNGAAVSEFSTDGTLAGNADAAVPTEKAVKTYVDTRVAAVPADTDAQTLTLLTTTAATGAQSSALTISKTNSTVTVPGDNLGTHTAARNLNLGANLLVGGGSTGLGISSTGNVGIGVASPASKLEVAGALKLQAGAAVSEFSTDGALAGNSDAAVPTEKAVKAYVDGKPEAQTLSLAPPVVAGTGSTTSVLTLSGTNSTVLLPGDNLGTHAAARNLRLNDFWVSNDGGNEGLRISNGGNVGVGVAAPAFPLQVNNTVSSIGTNAEFSFADRADNTKRFSWYATGDRATLWHSVDGNRLSVTSAGNVGIGLTNPTATLEVVRGTGAGGTAKFTGTTRASHFNHSTAEDTYIRGGKATSNVLLNDNGGNVGIGTAAPAARLHVLGSLKVEDGTESAGRVLTSDADGAATWQVAPVAAATNGLSVASNQVKLGGTFTENTVINQGGLGLRLNQTMTTGTSVQLDQSNTPAPVDSETGAYVYQTITAGIPGQLMSVDVYIANHNIYIAGNVRMELYSTAGTLLAATANRYFNVSTPAAWQSFSFPLPYTLQAGTQYQLRMETSTWAQWYLGGSDSYPGGAPSLAFNTTNHDLLFRTYVNGPVTAASAAVFQGGKLTLNTAASTDPVLLELQGGVIQLDYSAIPRPSNDNGSLPLRINSTTGRLQIASSARRYKENIRDLAFDRRKYLGLRTRAYNYKNGGAEMVGLIAEEVSPLMPDMVVYGAIDPQTGQRRTEGVDYERMGTYNLAVIQEHEKTIAGQAARIAALEAQVRQLQGQAAPAATAALEQRLKALENLLGTRASTR